MSTVKELQQVVKGGPCICPSAGWCQRHRMLKSANRHILCQTRADYRSMWDTKAEYKSPEPPDEYKAFIESGVPLIDKSKYKRVGLGDIFAAVTNFLGIPPCSPCFSRRRKWNKYRVPLPARFAPDELKENVHWVDDHKLPKSYGTPTPKWAVAMTAAPRTPSPTIASLRSLCLAGFTEVHLIAEPNSCVPANVPNVLVNERARGVFQNWRFALETIYYRKPDAEYFAIFQDDIRCSLNLRQFLERDLWFDDETAYVSPYRSAGKTIRIGPKRHRRTQWRPADGYMDIKQPYRTRAKRGDALWGALSYIFPRKSVELLLNDKQLLKQQRMIDLHVHPLLSAHQRYSWYYTPSLVEHVDGPSSIGHGYGRGMHSDTFRGESFDCLSLLEEAS